MKELGKFNLKINVIPNGLETYMSFSINNKLIFIDSFQFLSSSLDSLAKNLAKDNCKYLSQEFDNNTARKTIFPKSWNIMESSKRPSKYHLSINFLAQKKDYIWHQRKVQNKYFSVISKYHLSSSFWFKKRSYFPS